MDVGQEPFVNIPEETIREALKVVLGILKLRLLALQCYVINFLIGQYAHLLACLQNARYEEPPTPNSLQTWEGTFYEFLMLI